MRILIALLVTLACVVGCGFKGSLYLPARTGEAGKAPAPRPAPQVTPDEPRPLPTEATPAPK